MFLFFFIPIFLENKQTKKVIYCKGDNNNVKGHTSQQLQKHSFSKMANGTAMFFNVNVIKIEPHLNVHKY